METWQGFVFVSLSPETPPLRRLAGRPRRRTSRGSTSRVCASPTPSTYEVEANWKFIAENYSECYHCPGIHPQLNKLTPYDLGGDFAPDRAVAGRLDGARRRAPRRWRSTAAIAAAGRRCAGMTPIDERRIYYYLIWPTTFLSIHPDYLLVHRLEPAGPDHTRIVCEWLFEPDDDRGARLRPVRRHRVLGPDEPPGLARLRAPAARDPVAVAGSAGRYSNQEPSVHAFDLMAVDRYANDGMNSQRTVRLRYDVPTPKDGDVFEGDIAGVRLPRATPDASSRSAARAKAATRT